MLTPHITHSFHIPVMGLAYTIDSPIRVAHFGISSVISIIDDELLERMNAFYARKFSLPYQEITKKVTDSRAKRITSYLNLVDTIVSKKFTAFKEELLESKTALENFIQILPNTSEVKQGLASFLLEGSVFKENLKKYIDTHLAPGSIDVNIMTKIDKDNFHKSEQLPVIHNDAHAALRGFANSNLKSAVVLSAGMNPRLYSYFETFTDFFPDANGQLNKQIILKVSDYRSAIIQGKFLAKKGLWVSEYRIESGLNCGGHAFATEGYLLGPILQEFKEKKAALINDTHTIYEKALADKNLRAPKQPLAVKITVQGGVGTAEEHAFLIEKYQVDSVGWGSPFLLVPEATSVDPETRKLLAHAKESDLYLSGISPLGVPFNTVKGSSNEFFKQQRISENKAGSSCPKKFLALSKEFGPEGICTASKKYQDIKLNELQEKKETLTAKKYAMAKNKITEKACLCVGLANASYLENKMPIKGQKQGVVICPGPNLAYFDKELPLMAMVQHIYGKKSVLAKINRPHMFVKELQMYVSYLQNEIAEFTEPITSKQLKKWATFKANLLTGMDYYINLCKEYNVQNNASILAGVQVCKADLETISIPEQVPS
ncbi:hypothetical protein ACFSQP_05920 [Bizionia sediminis]|uniref:Uncharacterized protein n=1 Tax=Bizionia sediminis TaxID=1737064 RepID=A0ABW5KU81_9FLAO